MNCNSSSLLEPLNLTTIDDDCKTLIFDFFEWEDLLSLADTSKKLYAAACGVYRRKYGKGRLHIISEIQRGSFVQPDVDVDDRGKALKLLRNFGHLVSHLFFSTYKGRYEPVEFVFLIENYLAEYCSKTLKHLELTHPPMILFKEIRNPFINIENIDLHGYQAPICEFPFSSVFPNLNLLQIWFSCFSEEFTPICIPQMKKLSLFGGRIHQRSELNVNRATNFEENEIKEMLRLNPQLEELKLNLYSIKDIIFQDLSLPNLKRLSPTMHFNSNIKNADRYHFENVIDFNLPFHKITNIPFTFSQLERFEYSCFEDKTIKPYVLEFISENKYLKSVILTNVWDGINSLFPILTELNHIEEVSVETTLYEIPSSTWNLIPELFSQIQSLKKFTLWISRIRNFSEKIKNATQNRNPRCVWSKDGGKFGSDLKLTWLRS
ncbi:uncharacterized protein LOC129572435 [Sitodiplosis mosellana]|uniref:uncharacterized protein LOC129572435 n=1 Tax=Sitodiplosis mosellana TaxID=263140 RepID=UPI002443C90C|nr:uncharacterized protein LOC129571886 isoform X1 [Sitodiplosis mosellana]XP_055308377.1 uncharacterized protein LOC129572435 [Sitodiplosis mosellana]